MSFWTDPLGAIGNTIAKWIRPASVEPTPDTNPIMAIPPVNLDALDTVARTLWGECRGGGVLGMRAVAGVIANRAANPRWWGKTPAGVCKQEEQFSCWNGGIPGNKPDANYLAMTTVTAADPLFVAAQNIAHQVLDGTLVDITAGADSYFAIGTPTPNWVKPEQHTVNIGGQAFYRTEI